MMLPKQTHDHHQASAWVLKYLHASPSDKKCHLVTMCYQAFWHFHDWNYDFVVYIRVFIGYTVLIKQFGTWDKSTYKIIDYIHEINIKHQWQFQNLLVLKCRLFSAAATRRGFVPLQTPIRQKCGEKVDNSDSSLSNHCVCAKSPNKIQELEEEEWCQCRLKKIYLKTIVVFQYFVYF